MDADIKRKWVDALRSGKYKQARGKLKNRAGGFCCLGVLCDIVGVKPEWVSTYKSGLHNTDASYNKSVHGHYRFENEKNYLPSRVSEIAKVSMADQKLLANKNDTGASFNAIANYIERKM